MINLVEKENRNHYTTFLKIKERESNTNFFSAQSSYQSSISIFMKTRTPANELKMDRRIN